MSTSRGTRIIFEQKAHPRGQALQHQHLTFAAYNFVLIFHPYADTHTHTPRSKYASLTKGLVVGFLGAVLFLFPGQQHGAGGFLEWACKRRLQNFMPVSFSSFLFSFLLPYILFITIINNTKLHSGNPHCLQKNRQHWGEKGERERSCVPEKAADSTTHQSVKPKILSSFFFCGPLQTGGLPGIFSPPYTRSVLQV